MEPTTEVKQPTPTQLHQAERRIHQALDQKKTPNPADLKLLEEQGTNLEALLRSRQETSQRVREAQGTNSPSQPEPLHFKGASEKESLTQQPKKLSKSEQDYFDFVDKRLGPLMTLALFLVMRNWDKAGFYAFSPDECHDMASPLANIGPRLEKLFHAPGWVHIMVTASDDVVTLLFVMAGYLERVGLLDKIFTAPKEKKEVEHERNGHLETVQTTTNGYVDPRTFPVLGNQYATDI